MTNSVETTLTNLVKMERALPCSAYILQFGNLNQQQIDLISKKATELELLKDKYFQKQEKLSDKVNFHYGSCAHPCLLP